MFGGPLINPANQAPGVQTGRKPLGSFPPTDIMENFLKIFFSETMRPIAYILSM